MLLENQFTGYVHFIYMLRLHVYFLFIYMLGKINTNIFTNILLIEDFFSSEIAK